MRAECPYRRDTSGIQRRENEFIRPGLVRAEASDMRRTLGVYPTTDEIVVAAFNYVSRVRYEEDPIRYGDVWKFPNETFRAGRVIAKIPQLH